MAEGGYDNDEPSGRTRQRNRTLDWEGIDAENLRKLKQARGCQKGIVTRCHEEIRELMTDGSNASQVREKLEQLHKAFEGFTRAHVAYHNRLGDLNDVEESDEYFKSVERSQGRLAGEISRWIIAANGSDSNNPLEANARHEIDDIAPSDSISNVGSRADSKHSRASRRSRSSSVRSKGSTTISVLSARAKAAAKKAMLEAEATKFEDWQALKREELALQLRRKALELQTEIAKAQAEELAYAQAENDDGKSVTEENNTEKSVKGVQQQRAKNAENAQTDETVHREDTLISVENTKTPNAAPGVSEFTKSDASTAPQPNNNSPGPEQSSFAPIKVKSEIYEAAHSDSTRNDALVRQLLEAQFFQGQQLQALVQRQQESTLALTLPQPDIPVFSGNPIEYWTFIRAFENLIDKKTTSESARLYYLVQYTSGEVQELVKSCLSMSEETGYRTARMLLQKGYGSSYKIASTYVEKLSGGPALKAEDGEALKRFSIALTGCKNTLTEIGYLNKLENPDTLRAIVLRLPFGLRQKWRDVADNITETQNREITIADLSDFVSAKARAATHAVFGDISSQPLQSQGGSGARRRSPPRAKSSFGTQVETAQENIERQSNQAGRKCPLCKSDHWLSQCSYFKEKSLAARWQYVNSENLCANCLVAGHSANFCPKKGFCRVTGCNGNHSSYLHPRGQRETSTSSSPTTEVQAQTHNQENGQAVLNGYVKEKKDNRSSIASLALVPVKVKAPGSDVTMKTYAFLDNGSNASFCSEELATQLGLSGRPTPLTLTTMEREESKSASRVVSLQVMDLEEENAVELSCVFTRPKLPVEVENGAQQEDVDRWPHLAGIRIPKIDANVGLLIGSDAPEILQPKEVRESCHSGPYATRTIFGWVVNGPLGRVQDSSSYTANFIRADTELSEQFRSYCNMEFNDSVYGGKPSLSQNDKRALEIMQETCLLRDGHYTIALPWKEDPPCIENNRSLAEHRLRLLKKRLLKNSDLRVKYTTCIEDLLHKGYAKKAPAIDVPGRTWYLPHHAVFHPAKPGKVRIVFDCSAKHRGSSLNDKLLQGPDITNSLVGVLTRFRQEAVAVMADIESMFHQVKVAPEDCSALRFLWWPDGDVTAQPEELMMAVHLFGGVSSPSCANFALKKTAEDNKTSFDPETVRTVKRNFYVDDCLKSVTSDESAIFLVDNLTELLRRGGFRLTKWLSNSRKVVESIPEAERATVVKNLDFDLPIIERALGVRWDVASDTVSFSITIKDRPATRRGLLSVISSVYDPLGFVAPFVLPAKILLQDLCKRKFDWDDPIPQEDLARWQAWMSELPKLEHFRVERCFKPRDFGKVESCQLHLFSDASEVAYGAASYLRMANGNGDVHCSFVMGKSRLAPLKPVTIPRMELSAAVLSTRLDRMIRDEIEYKIDDSIFWTDSTCVLRYVENDEKRYETFVANRVSAIREQSLPSQWRYVQTELNPADDASRGISADDIVKPTRWIKGPDFLLKDETMWPRRPAAMLSNLEEDADRDAVKISFASSSSTTAIQVDEMFQRFSNWYKLKKFVGWILRFKTGARDAATRRKEGTSSPPRTNQKIRPLDVEELQFAERAIIEAVQTRSFGEEWLSLKKAKKIKKSSHIIRLDPVLIEGTLRVGGRLQNSPLQNAAKHPVILPKDHHISYLIARYYHGISGHSGLEHTLSLVREKYWIIKARGLLRRILSSCFDCRKRQAAVGQQKMASLPADRVIPFEPPFSYVGVDCFGPLEVRRGRSSVKRYGVLFTCMTARAIHVEIAYSLDTDSFLNALRRFIARRGEPKQIRSDNGGNFVKGEKDLREAIRQWNQEKIHAFLLQKDIKWIFNPPAGSHHGGVWERCIRTVRKVMKAILNEQRLDDEGLVTFMCEAEAIVNGRPLTKV